MLDRAFLVLVASLMYVPLLGVGMWRGVGMRQVIVHSLFYWYVIAVVGVTLFPVPIQGLEEIGRTAGLTDNFMPFRSIRDMVASDTLSNFVKIRQTLGNIILFIPLGFLVPVMWKSGRRPRNALLIGLFCSLGIELSQYGISLLLGSSYKVTDVDDLILNTLGCVIGFFSYAVLRWGVAQLDKRRRTME